MDKKDDCYSKRHQWLPGRRLLPWVLVFLFDFSLPVQVLPVLVKGSGFYPSQGRLPRANLIFRVEIAFCKEVEVVSFFALHSFPVIEEKAGIVLQDCLELSPVPPSFSKAALFWPWFLPV